MRLKTTAFALAILASLCTTSLAGLKTFKTGSNGLLDFDTPSLNFCCTYASQAGGGPVLSCARVAPEYWIVTLKPAGNMSVNKSPAEMPGCGFGKSAGNVLGYGDSWRMQGITCNSDREGLSCVVGRTGFILSRKGLKELP